MTEADFLPYLTLENLAEACGGVYVGEESHRADRITGAVTDSRLVREGTLFVPIKGARVDGHSFIPEVFAKGAAAVLSEQELTNPAGPYIRVASTELAFKQIAAFYRSQLTIPVIGITGSVGKTSTKEMIASVLSQRFDVLKTSGNHNNEIGVPLTIFEIQAHHEVAVLEMGISDFGEMHRLAQMAKPDIGVITNIGWCHLENLGTRDGILAAKTEMFDHLMPDAVAVLNGDDDKLVTKTQVNGKAAIFYGITNTDAAIYATDVKNHGFDGMTATIHTPEGSVPVTIAIPGEHNVYNALAATAVGLQLGLRLEEIAEGISAARTIAGRTNLIRANGKTVIDDCYNANPVSMKAALSVLSHADGRSIAVLGDMGELGSDERALHREVGACVGTCGITALFCAGELAEEYANAAREQNPDCEVHHFGTREDMTEELLAYVRPGDNILVKASHFMGFDKVVEALQKV